MGRKGTSRNGRGGAPTKFDMRRAKIIIKAIENGLKFNQAAASADISYNCYRMWRNKGKEDHLADKTTEYRWFYLSIKRALYKGINRRAARIDKAAQKGNWQADAWWLERVVGGQFLKKEAVAIVNPNGNPIGLTGQLKTKEEVIAEVKEYLRQLEGVKGIESNGHSNGKGDK